LATVVPTLKFSVDAVGRDWSHGYTVTNPVAVDSVTVMFNTCRAYGLRYADPAADR
jgi:hypothetical protein